MIIQEPRTHASDRAPSSAELQIDRLQKAREFTKLSKQLGMHVKVVDHGHVLDTNRVVISPDFTKVIKKYIEAPTIAFPPNVTRLEIKNFGQLLSSRKDSLEFFEYYSNNRLSFNNFYALNMIIGRYRDQLRKNPDLMNRIASAVAGIPKSAEDYDLLSIQEKVQLTKTLAKNLASLLT